ncbi:hypothetical protein FGB62_16g018 [Gracilaria domingensis]|nr:hypothetical protein FGB62_16g018 [Gracilaria domingensis]
MKMTSIAADANSEPIEEQSSPAAQAEPPAKKRKGGKKAMNTDMSAEERKRLRVLKNRESAMRSLAKKAEYSAKLETQQKEALQSYQDSRNNLESLVSTAAALKVALEQVPDDVMQLLTDVEASMKKACALASEDETSDPAAQNGTDDRQENSPHEHDTPEEAPTF